MKWNERYRTKGRSSVSLFFHPSLYLVSFSLSTSCKTWQRLRGLKYDWHSKTRMFNLTNMTILLCVRVCICVETRRYMVSLKRKRFNGSFSFYPFIHLALSLGSLFSLQQISVHCSYTHIMFTFRFLRLFFCTISRKLNTVCRSIPLIIFATFGSVDFQFWIVRMNLAKRAGTHTQKTMIAWNAQCSFDVMTSYAMQSEPFTPLYEI